MANQSKPWRPQAPPPTSRGLGKAAPHGCTSICQALKHAPRHCSCLLQPSWCVCKRRGLLRGSKIVECASPLESRRACCCADTQAGYNAGVIHCRLAEALRGVEEH